VATVVVTADHPIIVGVLVIGAAGISTSIAIPDVSYRG
jgi:hypothetical protein